jgi:hypothetical protein
MPIDFNSRLKMAAKNFITFQCILCLEKSLQKMLPFHEKYMSHGNGHTLPYIIESSHKLADISIGEIDPSQRLADIQRKDNK